jgi:hypothetical protein
MPWYFWAWAVIATILFATSFVIVLWASLASSQSGDHAGGVLTFVLGIPVAAIGSALWPIWFPFTFIYDITKGRK